MRKILVGFLLGVTTVSCLFLYNKSCIYSKSAVVVGVDYTADVVTVEDSTGNLWTFEGVDDYDLSDRVSLTMHDNGTDWDIKDDKIIEVRYDS